MTNFHKNSKYPVPGMPNTDMAHCHIIILSFQQPHSFDYVLEKGTDNSEEKRSSNSVTWSNRGFHACYVQILSPLRAISIAAVYC